mmetsp:Transcript_19991/g.75497  ORF Transcript_19991/g.75497 Transcript_19991/m.75497 type:complete len:123 (+) Transcript_19991:3071-3439(+)
MKQLNPGHPKELRFGICCRQAFHKPALLVMPFYRGTRGRSARSAGHGMEPYLLLAAETAQYAYGIRYAPDSLKHSKQQHWRPYGQFLGLLTKSTSHLAETMLWCVSGRLPPVHVLQHAKHTR